MSHPKLVIPPHIEAQINKGCHSRAEKNLRSMVDMIMAMETIPVIKPSTGTQLTSRALQNTYEIIVTLQRNLLYFPCHPQHKYYTKYFQLLKIFHNPKMIYLQSKLYLGSDRDQVITTIMSYLFEEAQANKLALPLENTEIFMIALIQETNKVLAHMMPRHVPPTVS